MSTRTSDNRTSTWVGIVLGVVVLGLIAAFAIALPKAADGGEGEPAASTGPLTLPDTLPGGYTAADLPEAFTGDYADRAAEISETQQAAREHGDQVLSDVLGTAVTRTYASEDLHALFVQAFRAAGGAFAPDSLPDPATAQGQAVPELVSVGDAACIVTRAAPQAGAAVDESAPPTYAQCQVSEGELTVQVGAQNLQPEDMVDIADHVLGLLQKQ
ncbi:MULTISPECIES: hypothetical protein [unclassified Nocardioides]|uniref:hypothetical protein n=1 Tax=unclassified Nocardioides TaxID=2615069 RepID=UPI0010547CF7|nr:MULTISPECIES: hypothetical protein [unclassified Nocardioides]